LIGMVVLELLLGFSSGFMKPVFVLGLILLLSAVGADVKVKVRTVLWSAIIIVTAFFIVVPVAEDLRVQINSEAIDSNSFIQVIYATNQAIEKTWIQTPRESLMFSLDRFARRQSFVAYTPGLIMQLTPSVISYQGIMRIIAIPTFIVPRVIWNNKPVVTQGKWFSVAYLGLPSSTKSSSAMTFFGEGYIANGVLGVILVGVFMGIVMAFWYKNLASTGLIAILVTVLPGFIDIEGDFTSAFVYSIQAPIFFVFVYWLITIPSSRNHHITRTQK